MPDERRLKPITLALLSMGLRRATEELPSEEGAIMEGPFFLKLALNDNSTTVVNLKTATQWIHDDYQTVYGSSNTPPAILQVEAVKLLIVPNNETPESLAEYAINIRLRHTKGTRTRNFQIAEGVGAFFPNASVSTTKTDSTRVEPSGRVGPHVLKRPLVIDLERDGFSLGTLNAVNMTAAVTGYLVIYGAIWPNNLGVPDVDERPRSVEELARLERERTAVRARILAHS